MTIPEIVIPEWVLWLVGIPFGVVTIVLALIGLVLIFTIRGPIQ